jgi:hypothetical protein
MVAIIEPQRQNSGDEWNKGIGAIGQMIGQFKGMQRAEAQDARAAESHEMNMQTKQMDLDAKKEALVIQGHYDTFDQESLVAQQDNRQYKPDFTKFTPQQARAYSDWQVSKMGDDVALTEGSMKLHKAQAEQQYEGIQKEWQGAVSAVSGEKPDYGTALGHIEKGYEMHNDGADLVFNKEKTGYTVKTADGGSIEMKFDSTESMFKDFADKMAPLSGPDGKDNYFKQYQKDQNDRMKRNAEKMLDSKYFVNDKGDQAQAATLEDQTGRAANRIRVWDKDGNDLGMISQESFDKGNFKDVTTRKAEAVIGKSKAETKKAQRLTADELKNVGTDEKAAIGISRIYGVDKEDAMDYVLSNKADKSKIDIVAKLMDDYPARTNQETGEVTFHPKVQAAIKGMGLEKTFAPTSETPGAGLRKKGQARKLKQEGAKRESIKRGTGVTGMTTGNTTKKQQADVKAKLAELKKAHPEWTTARLAAEARKHFTK